MDETLRIAITAGGITLGAAFLRWAITTYREGKRLDKFRLPTRRDGSADANGRSERPDGL